MRNLYLIACSFLLLLATSCQKKSGNIWEDNQTGARYSHQNSAALWGGDSSVAQEESIGPAEESFMALKDEDLKHQFSDGAIPQPSHSLGEGNVPPNEAFRHPTGELASVFSPVFFNTDDHILRSREYIEAVHSMASYLKNHPNITIVIEGHCDERAPEAYNLALGARRANYVRSLFIKQGVNPEQVHTISFGKEKPFAMEHNQDAWAQNRRAHFRVHTR